LHLFDFFSFKIFITPYVLFFFYYLGAFIIPFILYFYKESFFQKLHIKIKISWKIKLLMLFFLIVAEIFWRVMFEFFFAYFQMHQFLKNLTLHSI